MAFETMKTMDGSEIKPRLPGSLKVVAWFHIGVGVLAWARVLHAVSHDVVLVDPWVLGVFVGVGLLRLSRTWRFMSLLSIGIPIGAFPVIELGAMDAAGWARLVNPSMQFEVGIRGMLSMQFNWHVFGLPTDTGGHLGPWLAVALWGGFMWQLRVMTRGSMRKLFEGSWRAGGSAQQPNGWVPALRGAGRASAEPGVSNRQS